MFLRESFIFQKREETDDGAGNTKGEWKDQFSCRGNLIFRQGNETVIAARLQKRIPAFLKIRKAQLTDMITTDWRVSDERTREKYNIRAKTIDTETRLYYLLTLEGGVAT